jgi:hypothetical protein
VALPVAQLDSIGCDLHLGATAIAATLYYVGLGVRGMN